MKSGWRNASVALILTLVFTILVLQGGTRESAALGPTSPLSTPGTPRQGVSPYSFSSSYQHLPRLGSWVGLWTAYDGVYTTTFQIVPMLVKSDNLPATATLQSIVGKMAHHYWLVFNECEVIGQCERTPASQAVVYHEALSRILAVDPGAKLIIGGSTAHECGLNWMTNFVQAYRLLYNQDPPRAGWHFHIYPEVAPYNPYTGEPWHVGEPCPASWQGTNVTYTVGITDYIRDAERVRRWWSLNGMPTDEIWVTETGCLGVYGGTYCPANMIGYLAEIATYLNTDGRWINRYAWYTDYDPVFFQTWLMSDTASGTLTPLGTYYSQIVPASHVPGFRYLTFLPMMRKEGSSGNSAMINPDLSTFVSPLPLPSESTFNSPVATPVPTRTRMP